jgi:hypothetical protein
MEITFATAETFPGIIGVCGWLEELSDLSL